jgi:hypothetical protein
MSYCRTHYEAGLDIDYAIELNNRHIKLYRHLKWFFSFIFLVSGTAVFSKAGDFQGYGAWVGAAIAITAIIDHLLAPGDKIARHAEMKRRWGDLRAQKDYLTLEELDKRMSVLYGEDLHVISALQKPSYNANLRRHGRESHLRKLNVWEWLVSVLA